MNPFNFYKEIYKPLFVKKDSEPTVFYHALLKKGKIIADESRVADLKKSMTWYQRIDFLVSIVYVALVVTMGNLAGASFLRIFLLCAGPFFIHIAWHYWSFKKITADLPDSDQIRPV